MKRLLGVVTLVVAVAPAFAADVGVSVTVGQPGFYGTIDIGNTSRPRLIYAEPKYVQRVRVGQVMQPVYMRVPPGHAKNWSKHCGAYNACNRPVYFVQDSWYNTVYVPQYREGNHGGDGNQKHHDKGNGNGNGNGHKGKGHK